MRTPYDPALRVQQRAIDHLRISLRGERDRLTSVEADVTALTERYARENVTAAADWTCSSFAYGQRLRDRQIALDGDRRLIDVRVAQLRENALAASGQLRAIENAAGEFQIADLRRTLVAEQSEADDFSATRVADRLHLIRRVAVQPRL